MTIFPVWDLAEWHLSSVSLWQIIRLSSIGGRDIILIFNECLLTNNDANNDIQYKDTKHNDTKYYDIQKEDI